MAKRYDVFISHASEDKDVAKPLRDALTKAGIKVWYDDDRLELGDGIRATIDKGLADSRFGVVILSPTFFAGKWTVTELDALVGAAGRDILPVVHRMTHAELEHVAPTVAAKKVVSTRAGLNRVAAAIARAVDQRARGQTPRRSRRTKPTGVVVERHKALFSTDVTARFRLGFNHKVEYQRRDRFGGDISLRVDNELIVRKPLLATAIGRTEVPFEIEGAPCRFVVQGFGVAMKVEVIVGGERLFRV